MDKTKWLLRIGYKPYDEYWREPVRRCLECTVVKGLSQFGRARNGFMGLMSKCRRCANYNSSLWWKRHGRKIIAKRKAAGYYSSQEYLAQVRARYHKNKLKQGFYEARRLYEKMHRGKTQIDWERSVRGKASQMVKTAAGYGLKCTSHDIMEHFGPLGLNELHRLWSEAKPKTKRRKAPVLMPKVHGVPINSFDDLMVTTCGKKISAGKKWKLRKIKNG